jgi:nucleoside-diphosphate-sugar epimerase
MNRVVVTGAGGFIGGHVVSAFRQLPGVDAVRAVDIRPFDEWYQRFDDVENVTADLSDLTACRTACAGADRVVNLAADMGGMGFL